MLSQSGIPVIYSGDEIGQLNDYSYKNDSEKAADSRYLHRGDFNWDLAENRHRPETVQGKLFPVLDKLEKARKGHSVFNSDVAFRTIDTWDSSILALVREKRRRKNSSESTISANTIKLHGSTKKTACIQIDCK